MDNSVETVMAGPNRTSRMDPGLNTNIQKQICSYFFRNFLKSSLNALYCQVYVSLWKCAGQLYMVILGMKTTFCNGNWHNDQFTKNIFLRFTRNKPNGSVRKPRGPFTGEKDTFTIVEGSRKKSFSLMAVPLRPYPPPPRA